MSEGKISRRALLAGGAMVPLAGLCGAPAPPAVVGTTGRPRARNIVFLVSDGMSAGVPSLAEPFSWMVRGRGTQWRELAIEAGTVRGYLETGSLDSMVTDSAAAASAWGSGSRVANGAVNVLPDGRPLRPIASLARAAGKAVGLVTTTTITHATPAGFAAVQASRDAQGAIAAQYADLVDVALGGGEKHFAAAVPGGADRFETYRAGGYTVCRSREELALVRDRRVLGVFGPGHLPYTIDQIRRPEAHARVPTLREMTRTALACLTRADDGFLLQVEGGRVDHAAHNNDAAAMLWDQLAFDDAIAEVLAFRADHPDTLVVVTTDHGNANPGLVGVGKRYGDSTTCFERLAGVTASFPVIKAALVRAGADAPPAADDAAGIVREHTGLALALPEAEAVARASAGERLPDLNPQHTGFAGTLGQVIGARTGVAWTGTTHTSDLAMTFAIGPGSERFAGVMHHVDAFAILTSLMGVSHTNPRMSATDARRYLAQTATRNCAL